MSRYALIGCLVLVPSGWALSADPQQAPTETVVRLTVDPKPAPTPAMKYHLLPQFEEMHPGNAVQGYYRVWSPESWSWTRRDKMWEKLENWLTTPLDQLHEQQVRKWIRIPVFRMIDYAARSDTCDWEMRGHLEKGGFGTLLPDVQDMREVARWLCLRVRIAAAERNYEEAIETLKTLFAISRHLGEHPTPIGDLVGFAIASLTAERVEELIQQPGCPNLFWALASLPEPLVEMRRGLEGERFMLRAEFGKLMDPAEPWTAEELGRNLKRLRELYPLAFTSAPKDNPLDVWLNEKVGDPDALKAARERLRARGVPGERLEKMPPEQVILLDDYHTFRVAFDDFAKLMTLPYWKSEPHLVGLETKWNLVNSSGNPVIPGGRKDSFFLNIFPALRKVRVAQVRVQQRLGLLQHAEAVRIYAAGHDGKLPPSLAAIGLPLPPDPVTGEPFRYAVEGERAVIRGMPPKGYEKNPTLNVRYEVSIRK